jgi:hypothetical protein
VRFPQYTTYPFPTILWLTVTTWVITLQLFRAVSDCAVDFFDNFSQTIPKFPARIVLLKFSNIADPPDVVADPVRLLIAPR